jgi:hypothetical protein
MQTAAVRLPFFVAPTELPALLALRRRAQRDAHRLATRLPFFIAPTGFPSARSIQSLASVGACVRIVGNDSVAASRARAPIGDDSFSIT